jgi:hypothetical protein
MCHVSEMKTHNIHRINGVRGGDGYFTTLAVSMIHNGECYDDILMMNLRRFRSKRSRLKSRYYPGIFPEGQRKSGKIFSPGRDSNPASPEQEHEVLLLQRPV